MSTTREALQDALDRQLEAAYKRGFDAGMKHQREKAPPLKAREVKRQLDEVRAAQKPLVEVAQRAEAFATALTSVPSHMAEWQHALVRLAREVLAKVTP